VPKMPPPDGVARVNPMTETTSVKSAESTLRAFLVGRVCIVGVGNRDRGDDGVGPAVIAQRDPNAAGVWIDAGAAPENVLEQIVRAKPDQVLFIDAVNLGEQPGTVRILDVDEFESLNVSTHAGSLSILAEYLSSRVKTQLRVLGVQPERLGLENGLSQSVAESTDQIASMLSELLSDEQSREAHSTH